MEEERIGPRGVCMEPKGEGGDGNFQPKMKGKRRWGRAQSRRWARASWRGGAWRLCGFVTCMRISRFILRLFSVIDPFRGFCLCTWTPCASYESSSECRCLRNEHSRTVSVYLKKSQMYKVPPPTPTPHTSPDGDPLTTALSATALTGPSVSGDNCLCDTQVAVGSYDS